MALPVAAAQGEETRCNGCTAHRRHRCPIELSAKGGDFGTDRGASRRGPLFTGHRWFTLPGAHWASRSQCRGSEHFSRWNWPCRQSGRCPSRPSDCPTLQFSPKLLAPQASKSGIRSPTQRRLMDNGLLFLGTARPERLSRATRWCLPKRELAPAPWIPRTACGIVALIRSPSQFLERVRRAFFICGHRAARYTHRWLAPPVSGRVVRGLI
jgi:hypothetical protein